MIRSWNPPRGPTMNFVTNAKTEKKSQHYLYVDNADCWHLVRKFSEKSDALSVKPIKMYNKILSKKLFLIEEACKIFEVFVFVST